VIDSVHLRDRSNKKDHLALRLGLAGALGLGALVTGFILTRPGRRLVGDVIAGRHRTPLEGRVLDGLWSDRQLGRRRVEVRESGVGRVSLSGKVASREEVERARSIAERVKGVQEVDAELVVAPPATRPWTMRGR